MALMTLDLHIFPLLSHWLSGKEFACQCRRCRFNPSLKKEMATYSQYSCLENPMDRGVWWGYSPQDHKESHTTEQPNNTPPTDNQSDLEATWRWHRRYQPGLVNNCGAELPPGLGCRLWLLYGRQASLSFSHITWGLLLKQPCLLS